MANESLLSWVIRKEVPCGTEFRTSYRLLLLLLRVHHKDREIEGMKEIQREKKEDEQRMKTSRTCS